MTAAILVLLLASGPNPDAWSKACQTFAPIVAVNSDKKERAADLNEKLERWGRYALKMEGLADRGAPYCSCRITVVEAGTATALHIAFARDELQFEQVLVDSLAVVQGPPDRRDTWMREALEKNISDFAATLRARQ